MGGDVISVGLALLLQGATPPATAAADRPRQPPVFEANVALVAVPVFVTDKAGKAVRGLTADDFEIYDGGQRVPVAAFQAVDVDDLQAPDARLPVAVQAAMPRQFLLLFDLQFSTPSGISRTRVAAARFVRDALAPTDLAAVGVFGRGGMKILTSFTTDREHIARAIDSLGLVHGMEAAGDALGLTGGLDLSSQSGGEGRAAMADAELAEQIALMQQDLKRAYQQRVVDFASSLADLARMLSPLRGRKQVVLFSGGFAQSAWSDSSTAASPFSSFGRGPDISAGHAVRDRLDRLFRAARESDMVIHSVDASGLEGPVDVATQTGQSDSRGEGRGALFALASETGGQYIRPTNDFARALSDMDQVSRRYYVLAFQPADANAKGGRPRGLRVRVRRDGLKVSHRAAYVLPSAPASPADAAVRLVAAEAIAKGLSSQAAGLHLVALPYRNPAGAASVPVVLHIDGPLLSAAAAGDRLRLQVYGYSLADRKVLDSFSLDTTLDLTKVGAALRDDGFRLLTTFAAAPGQVDVRFAVRAGAAGQIVSIRRRVEVPAYGDGELALSPPVLTLPLGDRVAVPFRTAAGASLEVPFRLGDQPFLAGEPALRPGQPREVCVFVHPARSGAPLEVTAELASLSAPALPVRLEGPPRVVPDRDGFDRYLVTLAAPSAPPGTYALRLTFREAASGRVASSVGEVVLTE
jgi:VWFA-related protein